MAFTQRIAVNNDNNQAVYLAKSGSTQHILAYDNNLSNVKRGTGDGVNWVANFVDGTPPPPPLYPLGVVSTPTTAAYALFAGFLVSNRLYRSVGTAWDYLWTGPANTYHSLHQHNGLLILFGNDGKTRVSSNGGTVFAEYNSPTTGMQGVSSYSESTHLYVSTNIGLLRTEDGQTWEDVGAGVPSFSNLASYDNWLYGKAGNDLWRTQYGVPGTWTQVATLSATYAAGRMVGSDAGIIVGTYEVSNTGRVFKSTGGAFSQIGSFFHASDDVGVRDLMVSNGSLYVAVGNNPVTRVFRDDSKVYGDGWDQISLLPPPTPTFRVPTLRDFSWQPPTTSIINNPPA